MTKKPNSLSGLDIANHMHPYTNLKEHEDVGPMIITHGEGVHVFDEEGNKYIEALAGLWCTSLGFSEPRLAEAAAKQMNTLPMYHAFAHKSHQPVIELAEKLIELAPVPMDKVFFANSGSEANDTAIKMIWYYNNALGRPKKKKIITRQRAYHGVTVMSGSLTNIPILREGFDLPMGNVLETKCPHHYHFARPGETEEDYATRCAQELEYLIMSTGPKTIAAMFIEPVMGAGGVIPPPATYFEKIQPVLKSHDILLVADEVITGFGRTGNMFGSETFNIKPDMITMAKALSSGYIPISALMMTDEVYGPIKEYSAKIGIFGHGFTYSGHPVAAAVALETLEIYNDRKILAHVKKVSKQFQRRLKGLKTHPLVGEARGVGLIGALETVKNVKDRTPFDPSDGVGSQLMAMAQKNGVITRAMGDALAFSPPLIITEPEIDDLFDRVHATLDEALGWVDRQGLRLD